MDAHHPRVRYCDECLAGDHDLDSDSWRTDFLRLVRKRCVCVECGCTFRKVLVEEPRFDQRHYQPVVGRKRRNGAGARHAV